MHIVNLSTELAPIAKVGGLGDVVYGLSNELVKKGHTVEVILPKYDTIDYSKLQDLKVIHRELWSYDGATKINNTIWSAELDHIKVILIESHHPSYFFNRGMIYGCADDIDRFLYFTRAAMEFLHVTGRQPDCIHLHDWPVSIASTLYKDMYVPLGFKAGGTLLTIHNLEHQGRCAPHNLTRIGLQGGNYLTPEKFQDRAYPEAINLLKGGIEAATLITTVSPTYCKEILTKEEGCGLHEDLLRNRNKLHGVLNGIDENFWNPKTDPLLAQRYDTKEKIEKISQAKETNKKLLEARLDLLPARAPLVGCVTRLVPQKGPELIIHAIRRTIAQGGQFILLGSEYSTETKETFLRLQKELAATKRFGLVLERDEKLAHLIFAGSDLIIVPSLFEPCGLTQMIALRYGSIPLVRKTGGLADTVFDIDFSSEALEKRNGYVFESTNQKAIEETIDRAINECKSDPLKWKQMMQHALRCNNSWKKSGQDYIALYDQLALPSVRGKKRMNAA